MRHKYSRHKNYIEVNQLIEYLSKYKDKHLHYEDFLFSFFQCLDLSFGFRGIKSNKKTYDLEASDFILFYAISYHTLENNSRFLYNRGWYNNLYCWWQCLHWGSWKPKETMLKTFNNRYKQVNKIKTISTKKIDKSTKVYLMIDNHTGFYKIGRSKNPSTREKTLQSQKPSIELLYYWNGLNKDERNLHKMFEEKRVRGEWFDLNYNDIDGIKNYFQ